MTLDRYIAKEPGGCWLWLGGHDGKYGLCGVLVGGKRKTSVAHRAVYEKEVGPIPTGFTLDHLCRLTICVNPAHMEIVSMRENILRGNSPSARHARKDRCDNGHLFSDSFGFYVKPGARRACRACRREQERKWRAGMSEEQRASVRARDAALKRAMRSRERGGYAK